MHEVRPDGPILVTCEGDDHNEDGDAYPDLCDRCPGIADDQTDGDGDNVGDACDPNATEQNQLALFVTFAESVSKWNIGLGSWPIANDKMVYSGASPDNAWVLYTGVVPAPPYVLDFHYTIDAIDPSTASQFVLLFEADAAGMGGNCGISRQTGPVKDLVRITFDNPQTGGESDITSVTPGGYSMRLTYNPPTSATCKLHADDNSNDGAAVAPLTSNPPTGTLGFRSLEVGVKIDYIAIYKKT